MRGRGPGRQGACALVALALLAPAALRADDDEAACCTVVRVDVSREDLRLFWQDDRTGEPLRSFDRLEAQLAREGRHLAFAMNAGMYEADGSPVGLLVVDGRQLAPLNLASGAGNFFLKPNGVFLVTSKGVPRVVDAVDYPRVAAREGIRHATQSGPLLLKDGRLHPALSAGSNSRFVRNGVCAKGSTALFVISKRPLNLHAFASFFRDALQCRDALYFDGNVSSLYLASPPRRDAHARLGPMVGTVE